ncbi:MAG: MFS transporter [Ardenticatenaceae bacterium]|nr:MFS transporter [Ardenticatenaceae bacterium]MCB8990958.1 MFS transporter [Ardenticatenaceae bacterium]MCB9004391.1 MFS transporter [Ardenticatenaceae bacterium]
MNNKHKFDYGKTFIVGFGFLGISIIWPIFNQFVPIFLQDGDPAAGIVGLGLTPALALFIMTWDNLINVFVQPWVGAKSDATWNRFGRRKPWILLGLPIAVVGFVLLPFAQTAVAIATFILITNFGMALFRSPTVAWLGDLFPAEDRSKANGIINLMGGVGGLAAFFGGGVLYNTMGKAAPFVGGAILLVVAALTAVWRVHEPEQINTEQEKDEGVMANLRTVFRNPDKSGIFVLLAILLWFIAFNALEAGLSSFAVYTLGVGAGQASIYAGAVTVTFIAFAIPAGLIGTKYGRRETILVGLAGLSIIFLASFVLIKGVVLFVIALVLTGIFWSCVNVNSLPMVYDYGDERKIGAYTGLYYFSSQSAAVLGPTLGGVVVDVLGDEYRWLFAFSAVFMALAWLVMAQVRKR